MFWLPLLEGAAREQVDMKQNFIGSYDIFNPST